jgi:hypothetical protein
MTPKPSELVMYVVYKHPLDYPEEFICRRFVGVTPDDELYARGWIAEAVRRELPPGVVRMTRFELDDPAILEVWF